MPTQNFLMLLVLLTLMLRNVLATVWSRFWSWGLVEILNLVFGHDIEAEVWSRFWSLFLVKTLRLGFGQNSEAEVCSRFCGRRLVNILSHKFGQDLEAEVWSRFFKQNVYQLVTWLKKQFFWWKQATLGSIVPLAMLKHHLIYSFLCFIFPHFHSHVQFTYIQPLIIPNEK